MGDDGADDNNDFFVFLESRRGGVKLPRALRALVQETLTEIRGASCDSKKRLFRTAATAKTRLV